MTELTLYRYIKDNSIEWHNEINTDGDDDVIIFPYYFHLEEFTQLLSPCSFDDSGITCTLRDGYAAIWMKDICEYHGIDIKKVFTGNYYD